jgi:hypothetical protein
MAGDEAAGPQERADGAEVPAASSAVLSVLADLTYWIEHGVRIVAVEPDAGDGVRVGVTSHPATAEQALRGHYAFAVTCWVYE